MKRLVLLLFLMSGCTSSEPRTHVINGITESHTDKKFLGIPVYTKVTEHKTKEQKEEDIEVKEKEDESKIKTRRGWLVMYLGFLYLAGASACVVVGYITKGWKFWGGLALLGTGLGSACWGFVEWIPMLKWGVPVLAILAIGKTMHAMRNFDWKEWMHNFRKKDA